MNFETLDKPQMKSVKRDFFRKTFANLSLTTTQKISLRHAFYKDRVWLGTVCKIFLDFAENVHISVFWAETAKNEVRKILKNFRFEIWREI